MTDMRVPAHFPRAIGVCTAIMTTLYAGLASAGYWSKGLNVSDIVIFSLGDSPIARVAAGCILLQVRCVPVLCLCVGLQSLSLLPPPPPAHICRLHSSDVLQVSLCFLH